MAHWISAQGQ